MQMVLKLPIAAKAESTNNAHDGGWVCVQAFGHGAHAEQHVFAWMLEDWADNLLPLDAELIDAFGQMVRRGR